MHHLQITDSLEVSEESLNTIFHSFDCPTSKRPVQVEYIDLNWLYRHRDNFVAFTARLVNETDVPTSFYTAKFLSTLLDKYQEEITRELSFRQAIPYIIFVVMAITYFYRVLQPVEENEDPPSRWLTVTMALALIALLGDCLLMELKQLRSAGFSYFSSFFNIMDLSGFLTALMIILLTVFES